MQEDELKGEGKDSRTCEVIKGINMLDFVGETSEGQRRRA